MPQFAGPYFEAVAAWISSLQVGADAGALTRTLQRRLPFARFGIFLNPGNVPAADTTQKPRSNRSFEYDTLSDQYARFMEKEILPAVAKNYKLTDAASGRAICGISSGGICAETPCFSVLAMSPLMTCFSMSFIALSVAEIFSCLPSIRIEFASRSDCQNDLGAGAGTTGCCPGVCGGGALDAVAPSFAENSSVWGACV